MPLKRKTKVKVKKSLASKVNKSYKRSKINQLMVNPQYNKMSSKQVMPTKYRTRLTLIYTARESPMAPEDANMNVLLNGLLHPLQTAAPPPGVRIDGSTATTSTTSPLGFLDLIGSTVSSGLFHEYCVLNCNYKITYFPLALADTQYVVMCPTRFNTTFGSINEIEDFPFSSQPKFMVGYNSSTQNTISGKINMAKLLGYDSDESYAGDPNSRGTRLTNPNSGTNLVQLQVYRSSANGTVLSFALPYKIELSYDVEFTRVSAVISE